MELSAKIALVVEYFIALRMHGWYLKNESKIASRLGHIGSSKISHLYNKRYCPILSEVGRSITVFSIRDSLTLRARIDRKQI
jgi:hypothetical protein